MTAPASILASFAQPATRLASGDAAGAAMGGFEALLAMLSQSLQSAGQTTGEETPADPAAVEAPEADSDLAALLAGSSAWLAQAMSQAPTTPAVDTAAPDTVTSGAGAPTITELPIPAPMTRTDLDAAAELAGDQTPSVQPTLPEGIDAEALETLLPGRSFEAANASPLAWRKPMTEPATSQLPGRTPVAAAPTAAVSVTTTPAVAAPAVETAVVAQVLADQADAAAQPAAEIPAETIAAPAVIPPPVDAKAPAAPRKAAPADSKVAKVEASEPKVQAAPAEATDVAAGETTDEEAAPARLAAEDAEIPAAPARNGETAVQALAGRLETVAANATTLAAQVRGAPETVAKLAAGILDKLEGQSTKFDLQLDPHGLGKVDVSVEIASDGKLTAQLGFDSQLGLSELRGRAQELRAALEQAGFTLTDNALNFDFSGERRQQQAGDTRDSNSDQAGKAFARAMGSLDEELAAAPTRYQARRGLDLLI